MQAAERMAFQVLKDILSSFYRNLIKIYLRAVASSSFFLSASCASLRASSSRSAWTACSAQHLFECLRFVFWTSKGHF